MHRRGLIEKLLRFPLRESHDEICRDRIIAFVNKHADCFERSLAVGHLTGSVWLRNLAGDRFLLTYHKKLNLWLQLGGHADGDTDLLAVALREAREESGIESIAPVSHSIYDVDIHRIPEHKGVQEHYHYDIRFLCEADDSIPLVLSDESHDLGWFSAEEITRLTTEESILRMLRKVKPPVGY